MKYQTQAIAKWYWFAAIALFIVQVVAGLWAGFIYIEPNFLSGLMPFNIVRMIHSNALIVWLLLLSQHLSQVHHIHHHHLLEEIQVVWVQHLQRCLSQGLLQE